MVGIWGPVVQPGRTLPLRGRSRRFKSGPAHHLRACYFLVVCVQESSGFSFSSRSKSSKGIGGGVVSNVYPIQAIINNIMATAANADIWSVSQDHADMNNSQK